MIVKCGQCGREINKPLCWVRRTRVSFCDRQCHDVFQRRNRVIKTCIICGESFAVVLCQEHKISTCNNIKCRSKNKEKERNPNWRGGTSGFRKVEASTKKYKLWRETVLKRDQKKCVICGSSENLHADHIKVWAYYPEFRYDINNGRTLCRKHHEETYKDVFKQRKTLEQQGFIRPPIDKRGLSERECSICSCRFTPKAHNAHYCGSPECKREGWRRNKTPTSMVERTCLRCSNVFLPRFGAKYCGDTCRNKAKLGRSAGYRQRRRENVKMIQEITAHA